MAISERVKQLLAYCLAIDVPYETIQKQISELNPTKEEVNFIHPGFLMPLFWLIFPFADFRVCGLLYQKGATFSQLGNFHLRELTTFISSEKRKYMQLVLSPEINKLVAVDNLNDLDNNQLNLLTAYLNLFDQKENNKALLPLTEKEKKLMALLKNPGPVTVPDFQRMLLIYRHDTLAYETQATHFIEAFKDSAKNDDEKFFLAKILICKLYHSALTEDEFNHYSKLTWEISSQVGFPYTLVTQHFARISFFKSKEKFVDVLKEYRAVFTMFEKMDEGLKPGYLFGFSSRYFYGLFQTLTAMQTSTRPQPQHELKLLVDIFQFIHKQIEPEHTKKLSYNNKQDFIQSFLYFYLHLNPNVNEIANKFICRGFETVAEKIADKNISLLKFVDQYQIKQDDLLLENLQRLEATRNEIINHFSIYNKKEKTLKGFESEKREEFLKALGKYLVNATAFYFVHSDWTTYKQIKALIYIYIECISHLKTNTPFSANITLDPKITPYASIIDATISLIEHIWHTAITTSGTRTLYFLNGNSKKSIPFTFYDKTKVNEGSIALSPQDMYHSLISSGFIFQWACQKKDLVGTPISELKTLSSCAEIALLHAFEGTKAKPQVSYLEIIEPQQIPDKHSKKTYKKKLKDRYYSIMNQSNLHVGLLSIAFSHTIFEALKTRQTLAIPAELLKYFLEQFMEDLKTKAPKAFAPLSKHLQNKIELAELQGAKQHSILHTIIKLFQLMAFAPTNDERQYMDTFIVLNTATEYVLMSTHESTPPTTDPLQKYKDDLIERGLVVSDVLFNQENLSIHFEDADSFNSFITTIKETKWNHASENMAITFKIPTSKQWKNLLNKIISHQEKSYSTPEQDFFTNKAASFRQKDDLILIVEKDNERDILINTLTAQELKYQTSEKKIIISNYFKLTDSELMSFRDTLFTQLHPGKIYKPAHQATALPSAHETIEQKSTKEKYTPSLFNDYFYPSGTWKYPATKHLFWPDLLGQPKMKQNKSDLHELAPTSDDEEEVVTTRSVEAIKKWVPAQNASIFLMFDRPSSQPCEADDLNFAWKPSTKTLAFLHAINDNSSNKEIINTIYAYIEKFNHSYSIHDNQTAFLHGAKIAVLLCGINYENQLPPLSSYNGDLKGIFNFRSILAHRSDLSFTSSSFMEYLASIINDFILPYFNFVTLRTGVLPSILIAHEHPFFQAFIYVDKSIVTAASVKFYLRKPNSIFQNDKNFLSRCCTLLEKFTESQHLMDIIYLGDLLKSFSHEHPEHCLTLFGIRLNNTSLSFTLPSEVNLASYLINSNDFRDEFIRTMSLTDFLILLVEVRNLFFHEYLCNQQLIIDLLPAAIMEEYVAQLKQLYAPEKTEHNSKPLLLT